MSVAAGFLEPFAERRQIRLMSLILGIGPSILLALYTLTMIILTGLGSEAPWITFIPFAFICLSALVFIVSRAFGRPIAQIAAERREARLKGMFE